MSNFNSSNAMVLPSFEELTAEGRPPGKGIRWEIPAELLPFFQEFKDAYRAQHNRVIPREQILLKAVLYGMAGLMMEAEKLNQEAFSDTIITPPASFSEALDKGQFSE